MQNIFQQIFGAITSLRSGWRSVLAFQLWFAAFYAVLFGPGLAWLLNKLVRTSGSLAVSNYELTSFFLSVPGILFLVTFSIINLALVFLNNSGLVLIAGAIRHGRSVSPLKLLQQNLLNFRRLATLGMWILLSLVVLALPCAGIVALIAKTHLGAADINYYLAEQPPEWFRAQRQAIAVIGVFGLLGGWIGLRWSVAIQFALYSTSSPLNCLKDSWRLTRKQWIPLLGMLAVWWVGITLVSLIIGAAYTALNHMALEWSGLNLGWVMFVVGMVAGGYLIGGLSYGVVSAGVNELLLTNYFFDRVDSSIRYPEPRSVDVGDSRFEKMFRTVAWSSAIIAVVISISGVAASLASVRADQNPLVTAHRGSSAKAPENSLSALRLAIEHESNFAEIDVQHTADGQLVLMHDADFMRVSGVPARLANVSLEQARRFDISGKFKTEFAGEKIGTLQEAIDLARGKMKLNIELKYNLADPTLANDVVELVLNNNFSDQCVLTSLELSPLLQIEERWPELETGLILTAVVGDATKFPVDFYSLNSAQATPAFINLAHKRGKDIHVWTINTREQMNQMIEQDADNLITDVPDQVRELLRERGELSQAERMALRLQNGLLYGY